MHTKKYLYGKCSTQWDQAYPAEKVCQQFGIGMDKHNDHRVWSPTSPGMHDIKHVVLTSLATTDYMGGDVDNVQIQFTVAGVLSEQESFQAMYAVGFDSDGNPATGKPLALVKRDTLLPGADYVVILDLFFGQPAKRGFGQPEEMDAGVLNQDTFGWMPQMDAGVLNQNTFEWTPLPEAPQMTVDYLYDVFEHPMPVATTFLLKVPKSLLNMTVPEVPVVGATMVFDPVLWSDIVLEWTPTLLFDQERWLKDPMLRTFGNGVPAHGQAYPVHIAGLKPGSPFTLYLNDEVVATGIVDAQGNADAVFIFPDHLPNTQPHFLIAQDDTGEFAYSHTCPAGS